MAGRISFIDVSGFSLPEVGDDNLAKRWWRGGFPRAYMARDDKAVRQWHEDFIRTFLEQDIPQLGIRIPATTLRRFWTMVAHYHGQILQMSELARSLGTSEPTARRYLDILSGTHVVRQLPPWFENLKKRQVKAPKVYIQDTGVLHALLNLNDVASLESHPKLGGSWEGFAIEQILSVTGDRHAFFWATHAGAELDLLVFHEGRRIGFEIKYSEKPATTKSMRIAESDLGLDHLYVVHPGKPENPGHCSRGPRSGLGAGPDFATVRDIDAFYNAASGRHASIWQRQRGRANSPRQFRDQTKSKRHGFIPGIMGG